jgi:hypothetical protein
MKRSLKTYLGIGNLINLTVLIWIFSLPQDVNNTWLLGLSKFKLILIIFFSGILLIQGFFIFLEARVRPGKSKIHLAIKKILGNEQILRPLISLAYIIFLSGVYILASTINLSDAFLNGIVLRLRPMIFYFTAISGLLLLFITTNQIVSDEKLEKHQRMVGQLGLLFGLLFVFVNINIGSLENKTFTTDEPFHYQYGVNLLAGDTDRFDDSKMPFSAFNAALPTLLANTLNPEIDFHQKYPLTGRIFTILFSTLCAYLVYLWSTKLYGRLAGYFSLLLYIFDPNIIAHSRLITTDIFATGMILLSFYTFWQFYRQKTWPFALLSAAVLGFSQLAKYTSAYLYPLFLGVVIIQEIPIWKALIQNRKSVKIFKRTISGLKYILFYSLVSLIIINCGYLFNRSFTPLKNYVFRSQLFQNIQTELSVFGEFPVPVPYPYLEGLDWVKERERTGHGYGRNYLFGELRDAEKFNGYFIYAALLKVPIATQIFILGGILFLIPPGKNNRFLKNEPFLLAPILFFFVYFNFMFQAQMGIRFYLVIFPFLYILSGNWVKNWFKLSPLKKYSIIGLSAFLIVSVAAAYPHYIPYFNEFVWDQKRAYKYLVDSNLDWTQAHWYLEEYRAQHPEAIHEPSGPIVGTITASPNRVAGIANKNKLRWLRENFEPVDTIADTYLIYIITLEEIDELQSSK